MFEGLKVLLEMKVLKDPDMPSIGTGKCELHKRTLTKTYAIFNKEQGRNMCCTLTGTWISKTDVVWMD